MTRIIIDADGGVYGRLCSFAAKKALEGNEIIIVNSEKAIITGRKENIIEKYRNLRKKGGSSLKGPKYSKITYQILKRGIRGMLPNHRTGIGREAFKRITCYDGVPKELEDIKKIKSGKLKHDKYVKLKQLSKKI